MEIEPKIMSQILTSLQLDTGITFRTIQKEDDLY